MRLFQIENSLPNYYRTPFLSHSNLLFSCCDGQNLRVGKCAAETAEKVEVERGLGGPRGVLGQSGFARHSLPGDRRQTVRGKAHSGE